MTNCRYLFQNFSVMSRYLIIIVLRTVSCSHIRIVEAFKMNEIRNIIV
jgi:hypothetical protein